MVKVLRHMAITVLLLFTSCALFASAPEVLTLHLKASVPPRASVSIASGGQATVSVNSSEVVFLAYDAAGNPISQGSSFQAVDGARLTFTAV